MSVSSMESVAEFTVAEGTIPTIIDVPDDLTTATVETLLGEVEASLFLIIAASRTIVSKSST